MENQFNLNGLQADLEMLFTDDGIIDFKKLQEKYANYPHAWVVNRHDQLIHLKQDSEFFNKSQWTVENEFVNTVLKGEFKEEVLEQLLDWFYNGELSVATITLYLDMESDGMAKGDYDKLRKATEELNDGAEFQYSFRNLIDSIENYFGYKVYNYEDNNENNINPKTQNQMENQTTQNQMNQQVAQSLKDFCEVNNVSVIVERINSTNYGTGSLDEALKRQVEWKAVYNMKTDERYDKVFITVIGLDTTQTIDRKKEIALEMIELREQELRAQAEEERKAKLIGSDVLLDVIEGFFE